MRKTYPLKRLLFVSVSVIVLATASCKKDNNNQVKPTPVITNATPTKFGLYEATDSIYKLAYTYVSKIGTLDVTNSDYYLVFDTGSGGFVIDADGILPSSMITSTGFNFTQDSTVVNGITIYNQKSTIEYGDDANTTDKVYGNLAYANVTIGDDNGNIVIKRLPFFLYYKAVDGNGKVFTTHHDFDVLGVSPEYDVTFPNNAYITSPFSYFDPGTGLTKGFKMAALGTNNFSYEGTYVPGVVTLGLTASDLSSASGFIMHQLTYRPGDGYAPVIPVSLTYNNKTVATDAIFDTGTEPYSYLEDTSAADTTLLLPNNTNVSLSSTQGFSYTYTTSATENITYVENPRVSQSNFSVISLEFFLNNEYMVDYTNHKLGLKNN
ncbi:hypothetical protein ACPPVU_19460 [Mucilaginibacter sp. McL0603]|uniref:hypothetical protein n=1 Tax=Mucilaginibacter sp. McL0603 TaxID=3415670 RepID=UPI003CFAA07B